MPDVSVKYFMSSMSGAPAVSGTAGAMLAVLDACLLNGFGSVTLDSLVVSAGVATATKSTGHGFVNTGSAGPVVLVEGAAVSAVNGQKRITVTSATAFTFDATGVSDQTVGGTITAKIAPAGWTKPYSGTNKAVYARSAIGSTGMVLRIDDTGTTTCAPIMYESMSDVDTGIGPSTAVRSYLWWKSDAASTAERDWVLIADDIAFWLFIKSKSNSEWWTSAFFGDFFSEKTDWAYNCLLYGNGNVGGTGQTRNDFIYCGDSTYGLMVLARAPSQVGGAVLVNKVTGPFVGNLSGGGVPFPSEISGGQHFAGVWLSSTGDIYGSIPGLFASCHARGNYTAKDVISDVYINSTFRRVLACGIESGALIDGFAFIDIDGPWR